jgi:hypothetical protein
MSDRPWLEDGDPSLRVERALLKRLNAQQPPVGSADHGWAALAADIAGLQALGTGANLVEQAHAAAHAAKGGAGFVTAMKVAAGVVVAGGALWGGSALLQSDGNARAPHSAPVPAETPSVAVRHAPEAVAPQAEPEAPKAVLPPAPSARTPASETTLAEEGRLLAKAHQLVQGGQPRAALEVLRQSAARYPRSVLFQEREVLTIEALGATGASAAAKQRAQLFLKRYPSSPHAGKLKRFVE